MPAEGAWNGERLKRVILVACSKGKRDRPCSAQDLYVSPLFRKSRNYAELKGDSWFVLSAKYGLLAPDPVVEPYNRTLGEMTQSERKEWADRVLKSLHEVLHEGDSVTILAGSVYRRDLLPGIRKLGVSVEVPLEGMPIGKQLQWLSVYDSER